MNSSGMLIRMDLFPPGLRAVYFDAVGTLLFPEPSAGEAYYRVGQQFGSRTTLAEAKLRFQHAFAEQEALDRLHGYRTSEHRERLRWQAIVAHVLPDVSDPHHCFVTLWEHFADPHNWRTAPAAEPVLSALLQRGLTVGIASNFDDRLLNLVREFDILRERVGSVVCSSQVGWRKPAPAFFQALLQHHAPEEVLMVGDDPDNDFAGARAAGLHALLLDGRTTLEDLI